MAGTLIPPWYVASTPTNDEQNIATLSTFSFYVSASELSLGRCFHANSVGEVILWSIQVQCLMQIIVNRIAILMPIPAQATRLKWGVFGILLAVNISVFCIWIPARLQINSTYIHINEIWDRIEKGIFLIVDAGLNLTFIYLVKSRLIASGLTKYTALFRFNLAMIGVSMSLDIILIGLMSLPNTLMYVTSTQKACATANRYSYAQFHPLAYLLKLHIEMGMADLIAKIVKASNPMRPHAESRRDSNDIAPDASQKNSLSMSRSRRFSMPYVAGRWKLSSDTVQPKSKTTGPELELGVQANTFSGRAAEPAAVPRPRSLSRHITEPGGIPGLDMTRQTRTSRQDSSSTVGGQNQDVAWYV
ncbi:hypothetical protein CORC01_12744 [Colletotrichum orchidophilum]|uniref:Integral membrane protein n=1 Tax=Colletotrichum orchidophilum TaxID=1209926 RepID=A0A1G4AS70_9PEZI|nr:uncharacterized protein CORC01_12744 [Colletotrichum orchidophilum]OHE91956.1 hypothetical protein CORC01_12744 [Colletotrichum orchidophilum]